ncbi:MAG: aminopeptidase P family N-terminal domain-containing protein, partial [Chlamydiae bacterium]|nr:aminopeptidase P family N-terminal domain-containing protein [Chlamydiota bacterium]
MVQPIKALQLLIQQKGLDALVIEQPVDLFYLTGLSLSKEILIIGPKQAKLFVDMRYFEEAKKQKKVSVHHYEKGKWASDLQGKVGFDGAFISYDQYQHFCSLWPHICWEPCSSPLKEVRALKTSEEIAALTKAA